MKNIFSTSTLALTGLLAVLGILSGCMVGPNYKPPQTPTPAAWVASTNSGAASSTQITTNTGDLTQWWTQLRDPKLTDLINAAIRSNLDLQVAQTRLTEARASRGIAQGGLWPSVTASGDAAWGQAGHFNEKAYNAGVAGLWNLDIFGGTRRAVESATALIQASVENIHDAQVVLVSEVALDYIQVRSAQGQIAIAQENLQSEQHTADLTRDKLRAGFVSALDVANADAQVASTASTIPVLEIIAQQNIFALSVLLGRPPADLLEDLSKPASIPLAPPEVPTGLPSDLLRRRPDIRAAEANLHAAAAQIGVAEAAFFPQFSLTGSINYQNQNNTLSRLFTTGNRFWSVGPEITWPILQGGSTASNVRLQKALRDEAYLSYQKAVLTALQDVESALVAFGREWDHRKVLGDAVEDNRRAVSLSQQLYQQGTTDFLNVLTAERSLYTTETQLAESQQSLLDDLVALYTALGGGWDEKN